MKIQNTRTAESTFGPEFEQKNMSAKISGKFFDIVLDKMYTNKPRSILRELWTNALDAHVARGNPELPFFCQLPTPLDPVFTVRDYGCAMTHEFVMNEYSTMFDSTKTDDIDANDFVGAFGIGSKVPYAYTDGFSLKVWLDGELRTYLATRAADGIPSIIHLSTVPSDEEQGVEVSFPVQAEDFHRFRHEAEIVAEGFDVKPDVPGLQLKVAPAVFSGSNWRVMEQRSSAIRQGCVVYPVHDLDIETGLSYNYSLVVDVEIGTVQVAANREALSMDPATTLAVNEAFSSAAKELEAQVSEYIFAAPDLFDANVRWKAMQTFFTGLEGLTYHGQPLNGEILFRRDQVKTTPQHISNYKYQPVHTSTIKWGVDIASQLVFLVDRTGNAIPRKTTRLRSWVKSIRHAGHRLYILKDPTSKQLAALVRRLHLKPDQIVGIGSLPDVVIVRSPRKTGDTSNVQGVYDLVTLDPIATMADEFLWVEIPRVTGRDWSAVGGEVARYNDAVSVRSDLCQAWRLTGSELPVYALTPSAVKRVKPSPANNLLKVVKAHVLSERRTVARKVKVRAAVDHLRSAGRRLSYQLLSDEIVNRMLVRLVPDAVEFSQTDYGSPLEHLFKNLDSETYTKAVAAGIEHATKVADRYPLLFDTTEDDILRYVNSNPRKRKGSNAQEAQ